MTQTVLVVGAKEGSLGEAVRFAAEAAGYRVRTAGISGEEMKIDLVSDTMGSIMETLVLANPTHVVCTVGVNRPEPTAAPDTFDWWEKHMADNVIGPMRLLDGWLRILREGEVGRGYPGHYVAISSNSATVPRSNSAAYCASKAALSQALRVKAREENAASLVIYGYEPGLLANTPMTRRTQRDFPAAPLTRMRPVGLQNGIEASELASLIVSGLELGAALNGVLVPFDAGER